MFNPIASVACLLFGLTTPAVEQSLVDLESRAFQTRRKAEALLRVHGEPYIFRVRCEASADICLDKQRRLDGILLELGHRLGDRCETWWDQRWALDGRAADLMWGKDWPEIWWLVARHSSQDDAGWHAWRIYGFCTDDTLVHRRMMYWKDSVRAQQDQWGMHRMATKVWCIDQWYNGANPAMLGIVLAIMRETERRANK